ncbi:Thiamine-monophosphate kinase [uncultured Thiomicrorhabdus sp.]
MEFDLIHRYFAPLGLTKSAEQAAIDGTDIGIGDDGAVLSIPAGQQLVVVTDTLVSGVHFPENTSAYDIAWKALAVNLSDLAAMGATPFAYSLGLSLPLECASDEEWMQDFVQGFAGLVKSTGLPIALVGGDTTRSKTLTLTVSAKGLVGSGQAVLRSGAQSGDLIIVTGVLGEGALGLQVAFGHIDSELTAEQKQTALNALNRPQPQLALGMCLKQIANSAIDISDGLLQDLGHIIKSSTKRQVVLGKTVQLGAKIFLEKIPLSSGMQQLFASKVRWSLALSGGDDYQLCMTVSPDKLTELKLRADELGVEIAVIGEVTDGAGIKTYLDGKLVQQTETGFQHF